MKNRTLALAIAATLAAPAMAVAAVQQTVKNAVRDVQGGDETGPSQPRPPRYTNRSGFSVRHGKRLARKRRNQLRAKGQHRKAVR